MIDDCQVDTHKELYSSIESAWKGNMIDNIKDFIYHYEDTDRYYRNSMYRIRKYFIFNIKIREKRKKMICYYPMNYKTYRSKSLRRKMQILDKNMDKILSKLVL